MLCTDGLSDMLTEMEINDIMQDADIEKVGDALIERALDNGGRDNVTLVLLEIDQRKEEATDGNGIESTAEQAL